MKVAKDSLDIFLYIMLKEFVPLGKVTKVLNAVKKIENKKVGFTNESIAEVVEKIRKELDGKNIFYNA